MTKGTNSALLYAGLGIGAFLLWKNSAAVQAAVAAATGGTVTTTPAVTTTTTTPPVTVTTDPTTGAVTYVPVQAPIVTPPIVLPSPSQGVSTFPGGNPVTDNVGIPSETILTPYGAVTTSNFDVPTTGPVAQCLEYYAGQMSQGQCDAMVAAGTFPPKLTAPVAPITTPQIVVTPTGGVVDTNPPPGQTIVLQPTAITDPHTGKTTVFDTAGVSQVDPTTGTWQQQLPGGTIVTHNAAQEQSAYDKAQAMLACLKSKIPGYQADINWTSQHPEIQPIVQQCQQQVYGTG